MPSPPITCSITTPDRSITQVGLCSPEFHSSERSPQTSTSAKGTTWPKKPTQLLTGKKSEFTEAKVEEYHRRISVIDKYSCSSSPYYKGLTDFSLDINKERVPLHGILDASQFSTSCENTTSFTKGKNLTRKGDSESHEESLKEFNKRNAVRYSISSSPYYKGLTDFTLDINKEKVQVIEIHEAENEPASSASSKTEAFSALAESLTPKDKITTKIKNSEIAGQCLEETNAVLEEKRYSTSSPYYKGLTDFSLDINKEKSPAIEFYEANPVNFEKDVLQADQFAQSSTIPAGNSRFKKVAKLFSGKNNSELNKEILDALNKVNVVLQEKGYTASSPYYKGLTDFTLDINKEKIPTTEIHEATSGHSKPDLLPPDQSSDSSATSKGSTWSQKATRFFTKKKSSYLTESSLEEFNRRNAILEEKRYFHTSPYYKGLTDFTLDIKKEKVPVIEIHETASVTSSTRSSFVVRMQQLGTFCFFFKNKEKKYVSSSSLSSLKDRESGKEVKSTLIKSNINHLFKEGKPLRERDLEADHEAPSQLQTSQTQLLSVPQVSQPAEISETKETNPTEESDAEGKRKSFTWADTYRPYTLTDFICNRETATELKATSNSGECCHFIFEGKPGVGKRTMIWAFLREAFGADQVQSREECKKFDLKGEAINSIKVNVKRSSQHVEVNLSETKGYEKHVIVNLMEEKSTRLPNNVLPCTHANCRAIILYEADKLSTDALLYIRWLLERYRGCNKVFFCCNDASKLTPVKPLCRVVKLLPPSNKEIVEVLKFVSKQENIELSDQLAEKFADNSKNNLRQAIRSFEATWRSNPELKEDQEIMTGWEDAIANVARDILKEQSPQQLYTIRGELQRLVEHNVSPAYIFQTLVEELKKHVDESLQTPIENLYKDYNGDAYGIHLSALKHNQSKEMIERQNDPVRKTVQQFMKIEEFIAKFMSWYKGIRSWGHEEMRVI